MDLLLGDLSLTTQPPAIATGERMTAMFALANKLENLTVTQAEPEIIAFGKTLHRYINSLSSLDLSIQSQSLINLEKSLLASLPGRLDALRASLNAELITRSNLPRSLARRWHSRDDQYLIEIFPREDVNDNGPLRQFVKQLQQADPRVTGSPVISIEASDAVVSAFQQAFLYAFIIITIILLILLTHKRDTFYILIPLLMAAACTSGISVLFDIPFNFANIIALPLILGIGVDSGINILHRFRTSLPDDHNLLATSSARAVLVSTLTTMGSIGNLAFSPHLGTASMGKVLVIGIGMTLVCMLIVLPSLLAPHLQRQAR